MSTHTPPQTHLSLWSQRVYLWLTGTKTSQVWNIGLWNRSGSPIGSLWSQTHYVLFIALSSMPTCISKTGAHLYLFKRTPVCCHIGHPLIYVYILKDEWNSTSGVHFVHFQSILTIYVKGNFTFSLHHYYLSKHNYMSSERLRTSYAL